MFTRNTDQLRQEVTAHVAPDTIIQRGYWDDDTKSGCFIGCLAKCDDPAINEVTYGLPVMVQRIAESIFEGLPADDAKAFFAALPEAINCDGKDLTKVGWQFLAAELRSLPKCTDQIQAVIDPVITGMDLLASGQEWATDAAANYAVADDDDAALAAKSARAAARAATWAANDAVAAAYAALFATNAARFAADDAADAAYATWFTADYAANAAADAAYATATWFAAVRSRQRDLLLRLISEAPVVEATNG